MITNNLKLFLFGLIGGTLPLSTYLIFAEGPNANVQDGVVGGQRNPYAKTASYTGPETGVSFVEASQNSINSVVHVTTKVVQTSFQRDLFQEFF